MTTAILFPSSSTPGFDNVIEQPRTTMQQQQNTPSIGRNNDKNDVPSTSTTTPLETNESKVERNRSNNDRCYDNLPLETKIESGDDCMSAQAKSDDEDPREMITTIDDNRSNKSEPENDEPMLKVSRRENENNEIKKKDENLHDDCHKGDEMNQNDSNTAMVVYNPDPLKLSSLSNTQPKGTMTATESAYLTSYTPRSQNEIVEEKSKHKGLTNLGNTCYLNSALQMLFGVDGFVTILIDGFYKPTSNNIESNEMKESFPLHCALANLFKVMSIDDFDNNNNDHDENDTANNHGKRTFGQIETERKEIENKIRELKQVIDKLTPQFVGYWQQDSHEFLSTLLDLLHDEYESQFKKNRDEEEGEIRKCEKENNENDDGVDNQIDELEDETTAATSSEFPSLENNIHEVPDVGMKEEKEGYILVNQNQAASEEQMNLQVNKKARTDSISQPHSNQNDVKSDNMVEDSQGEIEMVSNDGEDKLLRNDSIARVSSFSELKVEDISVLLHGEQSNTSGNELPKKNSECNKDHKLVGGRVSIVQADASFDFTIPVDEEEEGNGDDGHDQQQIQEQSDGNNNSQPQHHVDTSSDSQSKSTPIDSFFTMEVQTCLTCDSCSFARTRKETFRHLSLEIGDCDDEGDSIKKCSSISSTISSLSQQQYERTIQEGLRKFFASEKLELKCEKCFGESATQSMEIVRLPKVLILHLKRFIVDVSPDYTSVSYRKNRSAVEFGDNLTLDLEDNENGALGEFLGSNVSFPIIPKPEKQKESIEDEGFELLNPVEEYESDDEYIDLGNMQKSYQLRSVVNHIGSSANCGHYTANVAKIPDVPSDAKDGVLETEREWLKFNDNLVYPIATDDVLNGEVQKSAYLLLYEFE